MLVPRNLYPWMLSSAHSQDRKPEHSGSAAPVYMLIIYRIKPCLWIAVSDGTATVLSVSFRSLFAMFERSDPVLIARITIGWVGLDGFGR